MPQITPTAKILTIDDEELVRETLAEHIERLGLQSKKAPTLSEGMTLLKEEAFDLVFLDINLPDGNGLEALPLIKQNPSSPEVIIITAIGSTEGAKIAIQNGAWDYITKPLNRDEIILLIERTIEYRKSKQKQQFTPVVIETADIIGKSKVIKDCINIVARSAARNANVLITGETGTGKELFARAIHDNQPAITGDYIVVDCAALPGTLMESVLFGHIRGAFTGADSTSDGLVKKADKGTLFLDEVGELPLSMQKTFLRVLQEKKFRPIGSSREMTSDFRLIAATNRDLAKMVDEGTFRQDLYHRLKTMCISLPPLCERGEDISLLAHHFVVKLCAKHSLPAKALPSETLNLLNSYNWPGNVRELLNALEKAILSEPGLPIIYPMFLPQEIRINFANSRIKTGDETLAASNNNPLANSIQSRLYLLETIPGLKEYREQATSEIESLYLKSVLKHCNNDLDQAAQVSKVSKSRFYALMAKYNLKHEN